MEAQIKASQVAPLVGAWIETGSRGRAVAPPSVAPLVGAWIETSNGLRKSRKASVAPLVGAWIETFVPAPCNVIGMSHPSWVRGLKRLAQARMLMAKRSHPSWVRGLKLHD